MAIPALRHFGNGFREDLVDSTPFKFEHDFLNHEAMSLDNLAHVIPQLPKDQVFFSSGLVDKSADFDRAHIDHKNGLSLEATLENIRTSNSYIMVRKPEVAPSFKSLFGELLGEVEAVMALRGVGKRAVDPQLYMFIASPDAITPFHMDRYSTMLFQFRGSKEVWVYPAGDERLVPTDVEEDFVVKADRRPSYDPKLDHLATRFDFKPGEALHIPFLAPHHVKNGSGDVSISLSIIFNTPVTARQLRALQFNYAMRRALRPLSYQPTRVGRDRKADDIKAALVRTYRAVERRVPLPFVGRARQV